MLYLLLSAHVYVDQPPASLPACLPACFLCLWQRISLSVEHFAWLTRKFFVRDRNCLSEVIALTRKFFVRHWFCSLLRRIFNFFRSLTRKFFVNDTVAQPLRTRFFDLWHRFLCQISRKTCFYRCLTRKFLVSTSFLVAQLLDWQRISLSIKETKNFLVNQANCPLTKNFLVSGAFCFIDKKNLYQGPKLPLGSQ